MPLGFGRSGGDYAGHDPLNLLSTTDAQVWAQEFMANFGGRLEDVDEGLMIGWFANAIEAGRAAGRAARKVVWAVEWGDEMPSEIDSLWADELGAAARAAALNEEAPSGRWQAQKFSVRNATTGGAMDGLQPGGVVQVTGKEDGVVRYGVYLGIEDGLAQIAFATANVPLDEVSALPAVPAPA